MEETNRGGHQSKSGTPAGMRDMLKKATTEMLVLFVLRLKPMYTYEMMALVEHISGGVLAFNTLYQAIYRLQEFRYIKESSKIVSEDNRVRVYFSVTDEGAAYLEKLIAEYHTVTEVIDKILTLETYEATGFGGMGKI
jgi:PadR family transcriptional regulator PadR